MHLWQWLYSRGQAGSELVYVHPSWDEPLWSPCKSTSNCLQFKLVLHQRSSTCRDTQEHNVLRNLSDGMYHRHVMCCCCVESLPIDSSGSRHLARFPSCNLSRASVHYFTVAPILDLSPQAVLVNKVLRRWCMCSCASTWNLNWSERE